jgi:cell division protein WhiA
MLVAGELKGELARIRPARLCCHRAELIGLLHGASGDTLRTLDPATARIAVQLSASLAATALTGRSRPAAEGRTHSPARRRHLEVALPGTLANEWRWWTAKACDRRAFLRGVLLGSSSISFGPSGPHVEFAMRDRTRAVALVELLAALEVHGRLMNRRGRQIVYLKGQEEIATLLRVTGANRALLDFETGRVGRDVQNRLNRLVNAEEANLGRTVRAADRQLQAITSLESSGRLDQLPQGLREAAAERRRQPEADLDALASGLGIGRSATNHRLRRLVVLAAEGEGARPAVRPRTRS